MVRGAVRPLVRRPGVVAVTDIQVIERVLIMFGLSQLVFAIAITWNSRRIDRLEKINRQNGRWVR